MDGVDVYTAEPYSGYWEFAKKIRRGVWNVAQYDVIIACGGRSDLQHGSVDAALEDFVATVRRLNPRGAIILTGPVPRGGDSRSMVAKCVVASKTVRAVVNASDRMLFSRLAEDFYTKAGVNKTTLCGDNLTSIGFHCVFQNIKAKLSDPLLRKWLTKY